MIIFNNIQLLFIAIAACLLCSCSTSKSYLTWIDTYDKNSVSRVELAEISDSSLIIQKKGVYQEFQIRNIKKINVRKRGQVGSGAAIGALAGAAFGAFIGYASGDDKSCSGSGWGCFRFTASEKAQMGGVMGLLSGAIIGTIMGSTKVRIPINGRINTYQKQKEKLEKYLLKM